MRFDPQPNLIIADSGGRIATAGGTTSWHDLVLYIIARHCSPGEALRIAKVYLLKWHVEGQLPYQNLVADCGIPERSLKRRFKAATGSTLIAYTQNLRIEEAKRQLESSSLPADEIAALVGYENSAFFRRLFKRCTGLTPGAYRRMFRSVSDGSAMAVTATADGPLHKLDRQSAAS